MCVCVLCVEVNVKTGGTEVLFPFPPHKKNL